MDRKPTDPWELGDGEERVLLFHGFSGSPYELLPLGEGLSQQGFRCTAPLLPGHGIDTETLSRFTAADWFAAGHDAIDRLTADGRRIFLVGFSAGGCLAIRLAAERSREVAALGLLAPALRLSGSARLYRGLFRHRLASRLVPQVDKGRMDVSDAEVAKAAPYLPVLPTSAARALDGIIRGGREALRQVHAPTVVLYGGRDAVVPRSAAEEAAKRIGSGPARLAIFPHSAHQLALDVEREAVAHELGRFFGHFVRTRE